MIERDSVRLAPNQSRFGFFIQECAKTSDVRSVVQNERWSIRYAIDCAMASPSLDSSDFSLSSSQNFDQFWTKERGAVLENTEVFEVADLGSIYVRKSVGSEASVCIIGSPSQVPLNFLHVRNLIDNVDKSVGLVFLDWSKCFRKTFAEGANIDELKRLREGSELRESFFEKYSQSQVPQTLQTILNSVFPDSQRNTLLTSSLGSIMDKQLLESNIIDAYIGYSPRLQYVPGEDETIPPTVYEGTWRYLPDSIVMESYYVQSAIREIVGAGVYPDHLSVVEDIESIEPSSNKISTAAMCLDAYNELFKVFEAGQFIQTLQSFSGRKVAILTKNDTTVTSRESIPQGYEEVFDNIIDLQLLSGSHGGCFYPGPAFDELLDVLHSELLH